MQSLSEYLSAVMTAVDRIERECALIKAESSSMLSRSDAGATSSTTPSAKPGGGGSAPATTGLTAELAQQIAGEMNGALAEAGWAPMPRASAVAALLVVLSRHVFAPSATGGAESQLPPSGERLDNWPSDSSDPTAPRAPSAPMTTRKVRALRGSLLSAANRLSGLRETLADRISLTEKYALGQVARTLRDLADLLPS